MSQLPGTIHIKRKLIEEPPETLYIEREGHESGSADYHARPVYRLVQAAKRPRTGSYTKSSSRSLPLVRIVQPPKPREEADGSMLASVPGTILAATTGSPIPPSTQSKTKDLKTPRRKRIFHLSMTKTSVLSRVSSSSSLRASSRQRGRNLSSVAVFAEKRAQMVEQMARSMINNRPETSTVADDGISKDDKARKRPLTQSLSSQKLKDLSASASVISAKEEDTEASLALATELQQFTLDTTESTTVTDIAQPEEKVPQIFRKRPMKYQPRPPPPRNIQDAVTSQEKATPGFQNTPKDIIMGDNNQEEWVYDIYVRDVVPAVNQESSKLNNGGLGKANLGATENVGYLVIRSEDEAAWEEFMSDDEDSEGDWGGEDEDSNAEDYYGNDYPDELESDDEWAVKRTSDDDLSEIEDYLHSDNERD